MNYDFKDLNIIDLISEKHIILRKEVEERWHSNEEEEISHTEGFLLAKISMGKVSLAEVARQANVSRQAMFKCAKNLESRGYLEFVQGNKNSKYTKLTNKGELYCEKSIQLKEAIEAEIAENIGIENVKLIKDILIKKWIK